MTFSTACSSTLFQLSLYFNKFVDSVENWRKVKDSLVSIKDIFTSTAAVRTNFSADVATISAPLVKCINSDCTDLAKEAIVLSAFLSCELKSGFATHVNQFCPALIQTLGKTNKILSSQGFAALSTIIANVKSIFVVHQICSAAICTNFIARPLSAKLFLQLIDSFSARILLKGCNDIEKVFSQGLSDPVLHIKEAYRSAFRSYVHKLPSQLEPLTKALPKEVLKNFFQSRAMPSAQIIQVATQSVKPFYQVSSPVQSIKKSLPIQVGYGASSSNMASSISSVPKHRTKPSSIHLSRNPIQVSSTSSSSAVAYSVSSASRLQLKQGTFINKKIPDYSHIKSKAYQGYNTSVKAFPTYQKASKVKTAIKPSKPFEDCPKVKVFSEDSKFFLATIKEVPSPKKVVPFSHTLLHSQKPAGAVCQKISRSKPYNPYPQSLLSQKHDSHRSTSHTIPDQTANNRHSNCSQRIVKSNSHIIIEAPDNEVMSRNPIQAPQSVPDPVQASKRISAVISQPPQSLVVPRSSSSKRASPFNSEEKDIKHRKLDLF
ncbi:CLIP-associating protein 1 [Entomophthora muscae]|uniref:CLIP-associating protein 1 n=1 Tax=Entomophthora muscae TaxID=34485 RepID=A0ACC2UAQ7_9FUNG|nr:CLIP-associating protein 1 [Entomophthora muscae]